MTDSGIVLVRNSKTNTFLQLCNVQKCLRNFEQRNRVEPIHPKNVIQSYEVVQEDVFPMLLKFYIKNFRA